MNKQLDLEASILAQICTLRSFLRLPICIQILNVLDLQFQGKRLESNTLASAYVKSAWIVLQSLSETPHSFSDLYRPDGRYQSPLCQGVSGVEEYTFCHDMSRVLACSLIFNRNAMHCILANGVCSCVCVCVCVYVCVCVCVRLFERLIGGPHENCLR